MKPEFTIYEPRFHFPAVRGMIERRLLINFRCEPEVLERLLPPPFRPKLINGWGMAGICMIRLSGTVPTFLPMACGHTSENAAHRIAVEWGDDGSEGVFIPRRDTNALVNRLAGGKIFPGVHQAADFRVMETEDCFDVEMRARDGGAYVHVRARASDELPTGSVFGSLTTASKFFQGGAVGWSARSEGWEFEGMELRCREWRMEALAAEAVKSSFFGDEELFTAGSAIFDSALLMRNIAHEWHARGRLKACEEAMI